LTKVSFVSCTDRITESKKRAKSINVASWKINPGDLVTDLSQKSLCINLIIIHYEPLIFITYYE